MHDPIEHELALEQQQFEENLAQVHQMDVADADAALAAEKRRHLWAIMGIWQRHKPRQEGELRRRAM